jgi:hypothetical protein
MKKNFAPNTFAAHTASGRKWLAAHKSPAQIRKHMDAYRAAVACEMSSAVNGYLRSKYGSIDLTWHPLFTACRELFAHLHEAQ